MVLLFVTIPEFSNQKTRTRRVSLPTFAIADGLDLGRQDGAQVFRIVSTLAHIKFATRRVFHFPAPWVMVYRGSTCFG